MNAQYTQALDGSLTLIVGGVARGRISLMPDYSREYAGRYKTVIFTAYNAALDTDEKVIGYFFHLPHAKNALVDCVTPKSPIRSLFYETDVTLAEIEDLLTEAKSVLDSKPLEVAHV